MYEPKLLMKPGTVGVLPTDTIYGLVARAEDVLAVNRLYELKNRDKKPGTVIAADISQLEKLGVSTDDINLVAKYWPGPVSVVLDVGEELDYLTQGIGSLAVRIPDDPTLIELLKQTGPLVTSSANHPGEPPANTINEARHYFSEEADFYIDGGDLSDREPSAVVKITEGKIEILRPNKIVN